jgi:hypothetical protein
MVLVLALNHNGKLSIFYNLARTISTHPQCSGPSLFPILGPPLVAGEENE